MPTIHDPQVRDSLVQRLAGLRSDSSARWGRMTASQMVCHLNASLRASLGELPVGQAAGPMARFPFNWVVIHLLPWPQGKAESPPEFLNQPASAWDADVAALRSLIERAGTRSPTAAWPPSRAFGAISGKSWGALHWKHVDHHLRQFGA